MNSAQLETAGMEVLSKLEAMDVQGERDYRQLARRIAAGEPFEETAVRRALLRADRTSEDLRSDIAWLQSRSQAKADLARAAELESQLQPLRDAHESALRRQREIEEEYRRKIAEASENTRAARNSLQARVNEVETLRSQAERVLSASNPNWPPLADGIPIADPGNDAAVDRKDLPADVRIPAIERKLAELAELSRSIRGPMVEDPDSQSGDKQIPEVDALRKRVEKARVKIADAKGETDRRERQAGLVILERHLAAAEAEVARREAEVARVPSLHDELQRLREAIASGASNPDESQWPLFEVTLDGLPARTLHAADEQAAAIVYRFHLGIRSTSHAFHVTRLDDPDAAGE